MRGGIPPAAVPVTDTVTGTNPVISTMRIVSAALACVCALAGGLPARGAAALRVVGSAVVPLDGSPAALPATRPGERHLLRLSGVVDCQLDGRQYDAAYRSDARGRFNQPHELLITAPASLKLVRGDPRAHVYTYALPEQAPGGESAVSLRFNTDKLMDEFSRPAAEVRSKLRGELKGELLMVPRALPVWLFLLIVVGPTGLALAATWALLRAASGPSEALRAVLHVPGAGRGPRRGRPGHRRGQP